MTARGRGGLTNLDDILKGRLAAPMKERDRAKAAPGRIQVAERPAIDIAPEPIEQFGGLLRENVTAEEIPFRKVACPHSAVQVRFLVHRRPREYGCART